MYLENEFLNFQVFQDVWEPCTNYGPLKPHVHIVADTYYTTSTDIS